MAVLLGRDVGEERAQVLARRPALRPLASGSARRPCAGRPSGARRAPGLRRPVGPRPAGAGPLTRRVRSGPWTSARRPRTGRRASRPFGTRTAPLRTGFSARLRTGSRSGGCPRRPPGARCALAAVPGAGPRPRLRPRLPPLGTGALSRPASGTRAGLRAVGRPTPRAVCARLRTGTAARPLTGLPACGAGGSLLRLRVAAAGVLARDGVDRIDGLRGGRRPRARVRRCPAGNARRDQSGREHKTNAAQLLHGEELLFLAGVVPTPAHHRRCSNFDAEAPGYHRVMAPTAPNPLRARCALALLAAAGAAHAAPVQDGDAAEPPLALRVNRAIALGVQHLEAEQLSDGRWLGRREPLPGRAHGVLRLHARQVRRAPQRRAPDARAARPRGHRTREHLRAQRAPPALRDARPARGLGGVGAGLPRGLARDAAGGALGLSGGSPRPEQRPVRPARSARGPRPRPRGSRRRRWSIARRRSSATTTARAAGSATARTRRSPAA